MDLIKDQYIEIDIFGIVILAIMLIYNFKIHINLAEKSSNYFMKMIISNIIILTIDIIIYLLRGYSEDFLIFINNVITITYFILHLMFGYYWFRYCLQKLYGDISFSKFQLLLIKLPIYLGTTIILSSPYTHFVFYYDQENCYYRGSFLIAISLMSILYCFVSACIITYEQIKKRCIRENSVYFALQIFPIPTFIGNLIQLCFYGFTIVWISSAISLLILFISIQNNHATRDIMTGLFNRRQTELQMEWEEKHFVDATYLPFVIMVDVDHFKYINDNYGHLEGDRAICTISQILKQSCRQKDFLSRFGGDEFLIIGHANIKNEIEDLVNKINLNVKKANSKHMLKYNIDVSLGYSYFNNKVKLSFDDLISKADKNMYLYKHKKYECNRKHSMEA